jgi:putative photosynthetic complex assembly protein
MSDHFGNRPFPRGPLVGAAVLLGAVLVGSAGVRATGIGASHTPDAATVAECTLRFIDQADGGIAVIDAASGRVVAQVAPGTNGFLRGTLRGLARERWREGLGPDQPFHLVGHADGRLTLLDPATSRRVDLESFGPTNAAVFAHLLEADSGAPPATPVPTPSAQRADQPGPPLAALRPTVSAATQPLSMNAPHQGVSE